MSDQAQDGAAAKTLRQIAEWYEARAEKLGEQAAGQFRLIVLIVIIGLGLLLLLPSLIGRIDLEAARFFEETPPIEAYENAQEAVDNLRREVETWKERQEARAGELEEIREALRASAETRLGLVERARQLLSAPYALWLSQAPDMWADPQNLSITGYSRSRQSGISYITGWEDGGTADYWAVVYNSTDGRTWNDITPFPDGEAVRGDIADVATSGQGSLVAVGTEYDEEGNPQPILIYSRDGFDWQRGRIQGLGGALARFDIRAVVTGRDGGVVAAGTEFLAEDDDGFPEEAIVLLSSADGISWSVIQPRNEAGERLSGFISDLVSGRDGVLLAVGEAPQKGDFFRREVLVLRSENGVDWTRVPMQLGGGGRIGGGLTTALATDDGRFLVGGSESFYEGGSGDEHPLLLASDDGREWVSLLSEADDGSQFRGRITALHLARDGSLFAGGEGSEVTGEFIASATMMVLKRGDNGVWTAIRPSRADGAPIAGAAQALIPLRNGLMVLSNYGEWWHMLADSASAFDWAPLHDDAAWDSDPESVSALFAGLTEYLSLPEAAYPPGAPELLTEVDAARTQWSQSLDAQLRKLAELEDTKSALATWEETERKVSSATERLESALIESDELRRASRIATRVAIVALLIYLVQIVLNKYRYLQRLEGFYRARAHSLMLIAGDETAAAETLVKTPVPELMAALSPDAIGFDKSAEPPTQNMMTLFRDMTRRG